MKKIIVSLSFILLVFSLEAQPDSKIVIIHSNDLHSHLAGFAPELDYSPLVTGNDGTVGGFARIASIIRSEKEKNEGITLVLDAGDFLMGTLFQGVEIKTGFQLRLMKTMGYDVLCIGNHEFDYGPARLADIISSSAGAGEIPALLLGNAVFDPADPEDDGLEKLFSDNVLRRTMIINRGGIRFGFFSLLGKVAVGNAAYAPPVKFSKQIASARQMVKELKDEGCDVIICLSHSGVSRDKKGRWAGEDVELARKVKGIDVIVSGHTHTALEQPVMVGGVPVVQTGEYGMNMGKLTLEYKGGKLKVSDYSLIPVNDNIAGDRHIHDLIELQKERVNEDILKPAGLSYDKPVVETDFLLECDEGGDIRNSNLGPLVADAIHSYVNNHVRTGTDISMVAVGVIRDRIVPGYQSAPDIFRIMSMGTGNDAIPGYPLSRVYLTGKELKSVLEILQLAYRSTPENYCYYSGLRVMHDPGRMMFRKIKRIELVKADGNVKQVDFSRKNKELFSVTANSYMLEFVGIIKKMSFGLLNVVPKDINGNPLTDMKKAILDFDENTPGIQEGREWLALVEYLSSMEDTNFNNIPDIDSKYREAIQTFIPVK
ncbi:MAG TPA: 5'-nucleotidase C-terminal domain-containing protein [Bacteroidales bacterium]|jgi:5'-nucleotidase|nr:5'-nucleotidase C-terminal domain-containing protein [Bacteroidales bacterium]HOS71851.1 5'-nucleotidase C-terminal domain-containing protein [Bacteroidales bacterium]HQH24981.1 5'-nucleotidase C-terminal domain-containing protein [Bacteroidales bacterium]HQJ82608.1 5'-nucleotidase C-terminal domain-containing protein [Bacteroidales bacterium]